jgi:predicted CoA-substrate-specific enzyme activase
MSYVMGIDIGSAYSKGLVMQEGTVIRSVIIPSGGDYRKTADTIRERLLSMTDLNEGDIAYSIATGYGANKAGFAQEVVTDITCHSKGIFFLSPAARTAVDVGDLFSKAFRIDERGNLLNFLLSGKCAGGSARILQIIAKVLQVGIQEIGDLSLRSTKRVEFSTGCAVFSETEAVSRIAEGAAKEDLLAGIHRALAAQIQGLAERVGLVREYALVGGGAMDRGLVRAVEEITGYDIVVPEAPQLTAALGAAILAEERI